MLKPPTDDLQETGGADLHEYGILSWALLSFCDLNSLDFLIMAWTSGQPSSSRAVLKTQVNLLTFSVSENPGSPGELHPFVLPNPTLGHRPVCRTV